MDWNQFCGQTITLFGLMKELDASGLIIISKFLDDKIDFLKSKPIGYILSKKDKSGFDHLFKVCIINTFYHLGWTRAHGNVMLARGWIYEGGSKVSAEKVLHELVDLRSEIDIELLRRHFLIIDPQKVEHFRLAENLLGENVLKSFPPAENDIKSAAHCLAVDFNTAAIFHLIRAAEIAMRQLASRLQVVVERKKIKISIDDSTWEELIREIKKIIESEKKIKTKSERKIIKSHFREYEILVGQMNRLKDDRNEIMHTHSDFKYFGALAVFERVRDFMERLAKINSLK